MEVRSFVVNSFTKQLYSGNPAGVCLLSEENAVDETTMLRIAGELKHSETAYIWPLGRNALLTAGSSEGETCQMTTGDGVDWAIRWFTPTNEVDLCGHATLAAAHVLFTTAGEVKQGGTSNAVRFWAVLRKTWLCVELVSGEKDSDSSSAPTTTSSGLLTSTMKMTFPCFLPKEIGIVPGDDFYELAMKILRSIFAVSGNATATAAIPEAEQGNGYLQDTKNDFCKNSIMSLSWSLETKKLFLELSPDVDLGGLHIPNETMEEWVMWTSSLPNNASTSCQAHQSINQSSSSSLVRGVGLWQGALASEVQCSSSTKQHTAYFRTRYFSPWNGIAEDPANGSSHTALAPLWLSRSLSRTIQEKNDEAVDTPLSSSSKGKCQDEPKTFLSQICSKRGAEMEVSVNEGGNTMNMIGSAVTSLEGKMFV
ncbi:unnamed protein product [Amoebophrya sp. A25]|nr:unnamed protein product [Amoebophrya sp. A25]|eukprot:GSA25T00008443001.1